MTVAVRWARASDASLPFVADGIPASIVASRIAGRCIAIAEIDARPVGALQLGYLWGVRPYIALIRVALADQRRGAGCALLAFVESALREAGHDALLSSSQANEPEPQNWHRQMGFSECGILQGINEGGVDEIFFRKRLAGR
jgi:hypothetical protein